MCKQGVKVAVVWNFDLRQTALFPGHLIDMAAVVNWQPQSVPVTRQKYLTLPVIRNSEQAVIEEESKGFPLVGIGSIPRKPINT